MRRAWPVILAWVSACGSTVEEKTPADLKERFPASATLSISIPGRAGSAGSPSESVFHTVAAARRATAPLALLDEYLSHGSTVNHDLSITLALEGAPRVVDQVLRYSRGSSRLDVERDGDHAFFYLQFDNGRGYDPDHAISEGCMLIEGSTAAPAVIGSRSTPQQAKGLASPSRGYYRFHFNHRSEDTDSTEAAAQLDYQLGTDQASLHLTYYPKAEVTGEVLAGYWHFRKSSGGLIYASSRTENPDKSYAWAYKFLAQYRSDGSLAVWTGEGKLAGCYDASGTELGNEKNPAPCLGFTEKFIAPPSARIWPALPGGVPR